MQSIRLNKFLGLNNQRPKLGLQKEYLYTANDIIIQDDLTIKVRNGNERIVTTTTTPHSLWAEGDYCFYREDDKLVRLFKDMATSVVTTGIISKNRMYYKLINGTVYMSDGTSGFVYSPKGFYKLGVEIPNPPMLEATSGTLEAGKYYVYLTWVRKDGQESGTSRYDEIDLVSNRGINIILPVCNNPDIAKVIVYISEVNSGRFYFYNDYNINVPVATISSKNTSRLMPLTEGLKPMPYGTNLTLFNSRLWCSLSSEIYYSEVYSYELFSPSKNFIVLDNPVIAMYALNNVLIIATTDSLYSITQNYELSKIYTKPIYSGSGTVIDLQGISYFDSPLEGVGLLCASEEGMLLVLESGRVINITESTYKFTGLSPTSTKGASVTNGKYYYLNLY